MGRQVTLVLHTFALNSGLGVMGRQVTLVLHTFALNSGLGVMGRQVALVLHTLALYSFVCLLVCMFVNFPFATFRFITILSLTI